MASREFSVTSKNLKSYGYSIVIVIFSWYFISVSNNFHSGELFPAKTKFLPLKFSLYVRAQNQAAST